MRRAKQNNTQGIIKSIEDSYRLLVSSMVTHPDALEVSSRQITPEVIAINTRSHEEDFGKLCGTSGKNFDALKMVMALIGYNHGRIVQLNRMEKPVVGSRGFPMPFREVETWTSAAIYPVLQATLGSMLEKKYSIREVTEGKETKFLVSISPDEHFPVTTPEIIKTLSTVFHAIGKQQGRTLYILENARESLPANA